MGDLLYILLKKMSTLHKQCFLDNLNAKILKYIHLFGFLVKLALYAGGNYTMLCYCNS